ncbi:GRIP and coiled-coil domain-containing protein 2-like [Centruroides sculpturatus]|uniref:GRIP and coiled-coil domain-containing protein 2-like n=1 Tax=Centruroides sculpturatus TaxID=218467 RepID=UPI000C6E314E|nr:GRIP and coiled-coil domain-containing protein 2-like [Centruroides sculpturatus]
MENETTTSDPNPRPSKVPLEHMTKEDLIKQVKRQLILLQKTKHKCDELNERCVTLEKEKNEAVSLHSSEANFKVKITELENKIISITAEKDEAILLHANMQTAQEQHLNKCQEYEKLLEECKLENHQLQESLQKMREKTKDVEKSYQLSEEQLECMKLKLETLTTTCQFLQHDMEKLSSENKVHINILL